MRKLLSGHWRKFSAEQVFKSLYILLASSILRDLLQFQFLVLTWRGGDLQVQPTDSRSSLKALPYFFDEAGNTTAFAPVTQGRIFVALRYSQSHRGRVQREILIYFPL